MHTDPVVLILMYFVLPVWFAAGFADWLCHRATHIETTTGAKESILHLLMFAEVGVPLLAAIFLEINALMIAVMIGFFLLHEATALWDIAYASTAREVSPIEQHVHSFLEMIPLMGIILIASRHWTQFTALFGRSDEPARFEVLWKSEPLPTIYVVIVLTAALLFGLLPYLEELARGLSATGGRLVPNAARAKKP